eukprot:TRINITY_DN11688_c0_g1_i1.p1 TRINITY_DN11688_c0_g1~~TRINITY_DN11688_c0_g1_i1.p1  ORF type:complete len:390 (+),score=68.47 TRINITY_DN11688_c0_g1_i1:92-1261(+)
MIQACVVVGVVEGSRGVQLSSESAGMSNSEGLPDSETPSPVEARREASDSPPLKKRKTVPIDDEASGWDRALKKNAMQNVAREQFTVPQPITHSATEPPNHEAISKLAVFSFNQMTDIVKKLNTRKQLQTVELGMYFFWRFYMGFTDPENEKIKSAPHSPDLYKRRVMMCACLFLAAKVRDSLIRLRDLVAMVFQEDPLSEDNMRRREQIAKAELYLIVVLRFEFNRRLPSTEFISELENLTRLPVERILGQTEGLPWVITAYRSFCDVSKTMLCIKYSPKELAVAMIKIGSLWVNDPWSLQDGSVVEVDVEKWEDRLKKTCPGLRIDEAVKDLTDHLPTIGLSQRDFMERAQQQKNRCFERRRSLNSAGHSPPPANPAFRYNPGSRYG